MARPGWAVVVASALVAAACGTLSPERRSYLRDLVALETAAATDRPSDALALASDLLARPLGDADRCPVLLARARALASACRPLDAVDAYDEVRAACGGLPETSAHGLMDLAVLVRARAPDPRAALPILRAVVARFPDAPVAKRAVVWIEDAVSRTSGATALVEELRLLYGQVARSEVGPYLLFEAARVTAAEGQGGDTEAGQRQMWRALAILDVLVREHPDSAFADDALLESAALATRLGRHWDAVRFYKAILAERETSWFLGSYDTPVIRAAAAALPGATARAESAGE